VVNAAAERGLCGNAAVEALAHINDSPRNGEIESSQSEGLDVWIVKNSETLVWVNRSFGRGRDIWRNRSQNCLTLTPSQARQVDVSVLSSPQDIKAQLSSACSSFDGLVVLVDRDVSARQGGEPVHLTALHFF